MDINTIKSMFETSKIAKKEYIDIMYNNYHHKLFQYLNYLNINPHVKNINIDSKNVIFTIDVMGEEIKLLCNFEDKLSMPFLLFNLSQYESMEMKVVTNCLREGDIVFDIGANIGLYTLYLNKRFKSIYTYSFEPIPQTFDFLNKNIKLNGINTNIYNIGLSNVNDTVEFYFNHAETAASSMKNLRENNETTELVKCKIRKLDDFVKEADINRVDFIKVDTEGSELFAFQGALETINEYRPIVFSEMLRKWSKKFNYHPNDIIKLFKSFNYDVFAISEDNLKRISFISEDTIETNYIFFDLKKHIDYINKFNVIK